MNQTCFLDYSLVYGAEHLMGWTHSILYKTQIIRFCLDYFVTDAELVDIIGQAH